ncbi:hypothetical protein E2C01_020817 [Portunus trituberculatus]|uniref:Uncharacterized protein n=1 Tax=Portunus trituberculatus TaxID=210409 RepID=A0A5B7E0X1_PORTR|nr:hypothetical protein [Portunus trituberculatus]
MFLEVWQKLVVVAILYCTIHDLTAFLPRFFLGCWSVSSSINHCLAKEVWKGHVARHVLQGRDVGKAMLHGMRYCDVSGCCCVTVTAKCGATICIQT